VGRAYKELVDQWRDILQRESLSYNLDLPLEFP
jgi:hypothetical protein